MRKFSLDRGSTDTSVALDALRALAAQMVCVGHGLVFFSVGNWLKPPASPYIQNVGVLLFFVMSGFWITATLITNAARPEYSFLDYFIDRFARIYSALIPALLLIIVVDAVTIWLTGEITIERNYNLKTLVANLAMLEGYRGIYGPSHLQWATFGSAAPLWTLAIEWHIYMLVGAVFFLLKGRGPWLLLIPVALFFGQTPFHLLFGAFQEGGGGTGLFALWLGGAALYLFFRCYVPPAFLSVLALLAAGAAYFWMVTPGREYNMATYFALVAVIGSMIAITQWTNEAGSVRVVRIAADYSFTLYLIHHTIMAAIITTMPSARGPAWFWTAVLSSNIVAYLLARPFEMRHKEFARWLRSFGRTSTRKNKKWTDLDSSVPNRDTL